MAIPEAQLDTWAHQGSITQSSATYATVKAALEAADTRYAQRSFEVFLQGSYANDTNIYAESDVDVVSRLDSVYYYDIDALTPGDRARFTAELIPGDYPYAAYKADVTAALVNRFGSTDVQLGARAVKIKASSSRRSADVIVATDFRRYLAGSVDGRYVSGICFFTSTGSRIVNYPSQHSASCTAKHKTTGGWFKPTVRIVKNMRRKLVNDGTIEQGIAPSYFIEGLLYNVPDAHFGDTYGATFVAAFTWLLAAQRDKLVCPNGQYYLVRDSAATSWPVANCDLFLQRVVELWNNWA